MSTFDIRVKFETLRTINSSTFTGSYQALGTPLGHDPFLIKMVNASSVPVTVSFDGTTDMDICPAGTFFLYDEQANATRESGLRIPKGTQVWVKGTAGTGIVYLVVQYQGV